MEEFEISAEARSGLGKGETRRLRRQGLVPAVIYGGGKPPMTVSLRANILRRQLENEAFYSHILKVKTPEGDLQAVLKDLQRHPATWEVMHVDLLRTSATQVLSMTVPLHFANEDTAPGVKLGGVVSHIVNEVDISCQAKDLPEFIEVDMGAMEMDATLHLSDITMPAGVELTALAHGNDAAIVSIHAARAADTGEASEASEAEGDEE